MIVRDGEGVEQALTRLRRQVCRDKALDKWPVWLGCYAKPSAKRRRKGWLRAMKRKWRQVWEERHRKQLAKGRRD